MLTDYEGLLTGARLIPGSATGAQPSRDENARPVTMPKATKEAVRTTAVSNHEAPSGAKDSNQR